MTQTIESASIPLTYDGIKWILMGIEKTHKTMLEKHDKLQEKLRLSKKKRVREKKIWALISEMEDMFVFYAEIVHLANEHWMMTELLEDPDLQKWWMDQINAVKEKIKLKSIEAFNNIINTDGQEYMVTSDSKHAEPTGI